MTIGSRIDRAVNAALITAAGAANRIMALACPTADDGRPLRWADMLADAEANREVDEPSMFGPRRMWGPLNADDEPNGEFPMGLAEQLRHVNVPAEGVETAAAPRPTADSAPGGHPVRATSELLEDAANRIEWTAYLTGVADDRITSFLAELRDRAADFSVQND